MAAAIQMIAEQGYEATSVDALCRRAGVDKSAVYWGFGSKEGLLQVVIHRVVQECIDAVVRGAAAAHDGFDGAESPPLDRRLDAWLAEMRRWHDDAASPLRVLLVILLERSRVDAHARKALRGYYDRASTAIAEGIRAAIPGIGGDVDATAELILAALEGLFLRHQVIADTVDTDRLFAALRQGIAVLAARGVPDGVARRAR